MVPATADATRPCDLAQRRPLIHPSPYPSLLLCWPGWEVTMASVLLSSMHWQVCRAVNRHLGLFLCSH